MPDILMKEQREKIAELREQVERLKKERDIKEHCIVQLESEHLLLKEQLAALAEQNEKMRDALASNICDLQEPNFVTLAAWRVREALSLPNLASPVLNRIRAEGMRMASEYIESTDLSKLTPIEQNWFSTLLYGYSKVVRARAAELENEDAN